jgi:hypothetical protein
MNGYELDKQDHLLHSLLADFRETVFPGGESRDSLAMWQSWQTRTIYFS